MTFHEQITDQPDWAGVVLHFPDGRLWTFQLRYPMATISISRDTIDTTTYEDLAAGIRSYLPGPATARIEIEGGYAVERTRGPWPAWATGAYELDARRAIGA